MRAITIMLFTRTVKRVHARNRPVNSTVTCRVGFSSGPIWSAVVTMNFNHQLSLAVLWIAIAIQSLVESLTTRHRTRAVTLTIVAPVG
jgi:hypothetical protein